MNVLAPVSRIMSKNLKTVNPSDSLLVVRDLFKEHNIHHIPVVRYKEIVGLISKTDFLYFQHGFNGQIDKEGQEDERLQKWTAADIMSDKLAKLDSYDTIRTALDLFKLNFFHALPVLEDNKLVGILTTYDIIRALADEEVTLEDYKNLKK